MDLKAVGEWTAPQAGNISTERGIFTPETLSNIKAEVYMPVGKECKPVDVGHMVNLRHRGKGDTDVNSLYDELSPSFTTYNMEYGHTINWEITGEVTGEAFVVSGSDMVNLLPPMEPKLLAPDQMSESWVTPPPEYDAPPAFSDKKKDEVKELNLEMLSRF